MVRKLTLLSAGVLAFGLWFVPAEPARAGATLNASWLVTYYGDPGGLYAGSQCLNFTVTQRQAGVVTGTWSSPTLPGWAGGWVQKGEHYSWYGSYSVNSESVATFDTGDFLSPTIGADSSAGAFSVATGTAVYTGAATLTQVKNCSGMSVHQNGAPLHATP